MKSKIRALLGCAVAISFLYFLWSFALTDRSLIYSQNTAFLVFQNFLWRLGENRALITGVYVFLVLSMFLLYWAVHRDIENIIKLRNKRFLIATVFAFLGFFVISNPALSYDLFNYIFDARMVLQYHVDPHVHAAIEYNAVDPWVRFMRNIFFPTTYGYVWTAISLVPYLIGLGKFLTVFVSFKLYMLLSYYVLFVIQHRALKASAKSLFLFFASPLVLLETLSSGHNDLWMMALALASIALIFQKPKRNAVLLSLILLIASAFIKRSTVLLAPIWLLFVFGNFPWFRKISQLLRPWWADIGALLLFIPLLTPLSRFFNPWYLLWPLSFMPFMRSKLLRTFLICFSLTSSLRYVPILWIGVYSDKLDTIQKIITWSAVPIAVCIYLLLKPILKKFPTLFG
ncbi:MAG TPA: hypothetical protein VLH19_03825 [Patescibacteria group bacterium]|nr:hypothetical protein [Patescibacteria group bacterium]